MSSAGAVPVVGARAGTPAEGRELRARGQRTVRKLLDAGVEVLSAKGFHATRVDDIVRAASTSHGTFYLYFSNKEDLFRALLVDVADAMGEHAESLGPLTPDAAGRAELERWLEGFARLYADFAPVLRCWVEAEIDTHEFGQLGAELLGSFAGVLTSRIAGAPGVQVGDAASAAIVVIALIERSNYYATVGQIRAPRAELVAAQAAAIHAALFGPT